LVTARADAHPFDFDDELLGRRVMFTLTTG
jgi:hypothetical protein